MRRESFLIPSALSAKIIRGKLYRPFQVWLLLKSMCDGHKFISIDDRQNIAQKLRVTDKTVKRAITELKKLNWIGHDSSTNRYFIRSIDFLRTELNARGKSSYWLKIKDILKVKGFCMASLLSDLARNQGAKEYLRKKELGETKNRKRHFDGSNKRENKSNQNKSFPISLEAIKQI